jgi:hypothetical protein
MCSQLIAKVERLGNASGETWNLIQSLRRHHIYARPVTRWCFSPILFAVPTKQSYSL